MAAFTSSNFDYAATGSFSLLVTDYLANHHALHPYYRHQPDAKGIAESIAARKSFPQNRTLLVERLNAQYSGMSLSKQTASHIEALKEDNCFTICTAHQPNIFTGPLYFIYKIIHAIKLAKELETLYKHYRFVPVYYMGSEDADLEELGQVHVAGKKYLWQTQQKGAVGRMKVDKQLLQLIQELEGQLAVETFGADTLLAIKAAYRMGNTIQQATLELVNALFGKFGLLVLIPDDPSLKKAFKPIAYRELFSQFSTGILQTTVDSFPAAYKVQTLGREINLFYLKDDLRERIERHGNEFVIANTHLRFSLSEMENELEQFPERFSPNVILRPLLQELLLPNIAFIGGGGELAYWLELKAIFEAAAVPYPVLLLRNSFLLINKKVAALASKNELFPVDLFQPLKQLQDKLVRKEATVLLALEPELEELALLYWKIEEKASNVDGTLKIHSLALKVQAEKKLKALEKKMFRAEKKKHREKMSQLATIHATVYPEQQLQERLENAMPYLSRWGMNFLDVLYTHSPALEMKFTALQEV